MDKIIASLNEIFPLSSEGSELVNYQIAQNNDGGLKNCTVWEITPSEYEYLCETSRKFYTRAPGLGD